MLAYEQAIAELAAALGVDASPRSVADALLARSATVRLGGGGHTAIDRADRLALMAHEIIRREGAERSTCERTSEVLALL